MEMQGEVADVGGQHRGRERRVLVLEDFFLPSRVPAKDKGVRQAAFRGVLKGDWGFGTCSGALIAPWISGPV